MEIKFKNDRHFEERIVQALIVDTPFAEQMLEVLDVNYFNIDYLRKLCVLMFDYHGKYSSFPSFKLLVTLIKDEKNHVLREQLINYMVKIKRDPMNGDIQYVKEQSLDFCKRRSLARALESSLDLIDEKKYEQIIKVIEKAVLVGSERDVGHMFKEHFEKRMIIKERKTVPTPWDRVNKLLDGGVGPGELCVMCAGTGVGKSHCLVDIGHHALKLGYNVVHYTFELGDVQVGRRYDSRFTGIPPEQLVDNKETVKKVVESIKGKLVIKSYPTKSVTTMAIKNHLYQLALRDMKPDILIVDYGDLMRSQHRYEQKRLEEESVYEDLRGLSQELGLPIWTATQTNREGSDAEVVTLKHVSECFGKAMISDLFITMARKKENSSKTIGNFFIAKNRMGPDGIKFPILVNTATSRIDVMSPEEIDEEEASPHNHLKKKFREFQKEDKKEE